MSDLDDIVKEFLVESTENLDQLDRDLVVLEKAPADRATLGSVFRTIHTIKGTCGFFGFTKLEAVTHVGENLLSRLREGLQPLTSDVTTALLHLVDAVRELLGRIEATGGEGDGDYAPLIARLTQLQQAKAIAVVEPTPPPVAKPTGEACAIDASIRVDVSVLDKLMNLVGELVLARNQAVLAAPPTDDASFHRAVQHLTQITRELQDAVMTTRMQPVGVLWDRYPRIIRDLAAQLGKQVRVEFEGSETELDRGILEAVKDSFIHVIRNAIDHGIESPAIRQARGKPAEGLLKMRAAHEGGQVVIEVSDDGGGISPDRVRAKAVENGLISAEQAGRLPDHDAVMMIFLPGFSTADAVTNISGRGVGMDVVKTSIERIGGRLEVQSTLNIGTTLRVRIPLTLAIIPAIILVCDGERFAIPQMSLVQLVRLDRTAAHTSAEQVHGLPVFRLRNELLPLVDLRDVLHLGSVHDRDERTILVVQAEDRRFGLVVDRVLDSQEIVVKPLDEQLKPLTVYSGATILDDGGVGLILDVLGLARAAGVLSPPGRDRVRVRVSPPPPADVQPWLLLESGQDRRFALPMNLVVRIEEVAIDQIESAGRLAVIQYHGDVLPLVKLADALGDPPRPWVGESISVVIFRDDGRLIGLAVDRVVDILEAAPRPQPTAARPGVTGTAVLADRVAELIDVVAVLRLTDPWAVLAAEVGAP